MIGIMNMRSPTPGTGPLVGGWGECQGRGARGGEREGGGRGQRASKDGADDAGVEVAERLVEEGEEDDDELRTAAWRETAGGVRGRSSTSGGADGPHPASHAEADAEAEAISGNLGHSRSLSVTLGHSRSLSVTLGPASR